MIIQYAIQPSLFSCLNDNMKRYVFPFSFSFNSYHSTDCFDCLFVVFVGHLAALTRSHPIGDHPSGLTKE